MEGHPLGDRGEEEWDEELWKGRLGGGNDWTVKNIIIIIIKQDSRSKPNQSTKLTKRIFTQSCC